MTRRSLFAGVGLVVLALVVVPPPSQVAGALSQSPGVTVSTYPQLLFNGQNRVNPTETTLSATNVDRLAKKWSYLATGGSYAPYAAPVEDGGVVFEGLYNCCPSASKVVALNAATGTLIWTFPTNTAVVGTLAVSNGVVFVGDYNGVLHAVNEKTGKQLWSGNAGTQFFDPDHITVSGTRVLTVTTARGGFGGSTLAVWSRSGCGAAVCHPLWTASLAGAAWGAASDGTRVFVADTGGTLYAFNQAGCGTKSCKAVWTGSYSAGNIYGSLIVSGGLVFVGSQRGSVVDAFLAIGCSSSPCATTEQYNAPGTEPSGLAFANNLLFVGDTAGVAAFDVSCSGLCQPLWTDTTAPGAKIIEANGIIYGVSGASVFADNAKTGARLWQESTSAKATPASGPSVANGMVFVGQTGVAEVDGYALAPVDTDDNIKPASTSVTASLAAGTSLSVSGSINGLSITATCTTSSFSFTTPATGLGPVSTSAPTITGCTDNATATSATVTPSGTFTVSLADPLNDEWAELPNDVLKWTIPQGGLTITSSFLPGCTVTLAPSGPVVLNASYDDHGTATVVNASVPASASGCTVSPRATVSETLAVSPAISDGS
jgi:outer membrane protein assembly factor BamB